MDIDVEKGPKGIKQENDECHLIITKVESQKNGTTLEEAEVVVDIKPNGFKLEFYETGSEFEEDEDIESKNISEHTYWLRSSSTSTHSSLTRQDEDDISESTDELRPSPPTSLGEEVQAAQPGQTEERSQTPPAAEETASDAPSSKWHNSDFEPKSFPFTAEPGPRSAAGTLTSDNPTDFVELFLTDELLEKIVVQTNLYMQQFLRSGVDIAPQSAVYRWKPTTLSEMKKFLGLYFLTGVIRKPELAAYWATDEMMATPFFSKVISSKQFLLIWRFLHFNDNQARPADCTDKLYKVRPVLDYLTTRFREMYQPNVNISIAEGLVLCQEHPGFRVFNDTTPDQYGMKSHILCDAKTGYCFNLKPHLGKASVVGETVVSLLDCLVGHGYKLFMDSYYNSVFLCERLLKLKTHVCGTLRKNRGEPSDLQNLTKADIQRGNAIKRHNDNVMVLAFHDNQIFKMITSSHSNIMQNVNARYKDRPADMKPECVVSYVNAMSGIEKLDRSLVYYPCVRKSDKWTHKFVTSLFEISLFNAYVLYREKGHSGTFLSFVKSLVKSWTGHELETPVTVCDENNSDDSEEPPPKIVPRAPKHDPQSRLVGGIACHTILRIPSTETKKYPSRRCRVCARNGVRSDTRYYCLECGVPLHFGKCNKLYHSKQDYRGHAQDKKKQIPPQPKLRRKGVVTF